jgi:hypothetical protein
MLSGVDQRPLDLESASTGFAACDRMEGGTGRQGLLVMAPVLSF